jgi:hypothetical protein
METTDEVPDWAKVWLDLDVAAWLHEVADKYFAGSVQLALNEMLRVPMAMSQKPDDRWVGLEAKKKAHEAGERHAQWLKQRR